MELEGECKIAEITLIRLRILKAVLLTILAVASVVGFFLLFYYKRVRVYLWFS